MDRLFPLRMSQPGLLAFLGLLAFNMACLLAYAFGVTLGVLLAFRVMG